MVYYWVDSSSSASTDSSDYVFSTTTTVTTGWVVDEYELDIGWLATSDAEMEYEDNRLDKTRAWRLKMKEIDRRKHAMFKSQMMSQIDVRRDTQGKSGRW